MGGDPSTARAPRVRRRTLLGLGLGALAVGGTATALGHGSPVDSPALRQTMGALFGTTVISGIVYADLPGAAGRMDLYLPEGEGPFPVLAWNAGSGWRSDRGFQGGDAVARGLVPAGYAVAAFSVRSAREDAFPAQVLDATAAVRHLRENAGELRVDPGRIAVGGNSSGGWNALMAGLTGGRDLDRSAVPAPGDEVPEGGHAIPEEDRVQAIVDCFAPVDFLQMNVQMPRGACEEYDRRNHTRHCHLDDASTKSRMLGAPVMARPELARLANPAVHVTPAAPPTLIVHGRADREVPYVQSRGLYQAYVASGVPVAMYSVEGAGHDLQMMARRVGRTDVVRSGLPRQAVHGSISWSAVAAFLDVAMPRPRR